LLPVCRTPARVAVRYSGYLNRGDAFQADEVVTFAVGERKTIAGLSWGVEGCASVVVAGFVSVHTWRTATKGCPV
jgi:hypothetical protein